MKIITILLGCVALLFTTSLQAKTYANRLCELSDYTCMKVKRGQTWVSLFPDTQTRDFIKRLNRVNIKLHPGMRIAVPTYRYSPDVMMISPFEHQIEPQGHKLVVVDPSVLAWGAYDESGNLVRWGPASLGAHWCADVGRSCRTTRGEYSFFRKQGASCESSKFPLPYGGAPMPYCMHFHQGFALHGSATVPGYNASHGCIRVFTEDARWLNENFVDVKGNRTQILINPY